METESDGNSTRMILLENMARYFKTHHAMPAIAQERYARAVAKIPEIALNDIVSRLMDERKPTSANFPTIQEIRAAWYRWQHDNPHKVVSRKPEIMPCDDCGGTGLLTYRKPSPTRNDKPIYPHDIQETCWCGKCDNWKRHCNDITGDRRFTLLHIQHQGWSTWPFTRPGNRTGENSIDKMVNQATEDIGDMKYELDFNEPEYRERIRQLKEQARQITEEDIPF